jgi:hypothetical protein
MKLVELGQTRPPEGQRRQLVVAVWLAIGDGETGESALPVEQTGLVVDA